MAERACWKEFLRGREEEMKIGHGGRVSRNVHTLTSGICEDLGYMATAN